jgi:hypothetical protein
VALATVTADGTVVNVEKTFKPPKLDQRPVWDATVMARFWIPSYPFEWVGTVRASLPHVAATRAIQDGMREIIKRPALNGRRRKLLQVIVKVNRVS